MGMNKKKTTTMRWALPVLAAMNLLVGCGDEVVPEPEPTFPSNPGPIQLSVAQMGLPMELHAAYETNFAKYGTYTDSVSAIFVTEQIYSEYRQATQGASSDAQFHNRIEALYEEFDEELAGYGTHYLVLDLQRRDRQWLVDWEGLERDEPEHRADYLYFGYQERREDYWIDVQDRVQSAIGNIRQAAPDANLAGVIIGMEMNRYYDQNPDDWDEFVEFYWTVYDSIKALDSSIRVSVGMNWSYFMDQQINQFLEGGETVVDVLPFNRAYEAIIRPLIYRQDGSGTTSDFVALAAIPDSSRYTGVPANVTDGHFAGLRLIFPVGTLPIVWFQVGWPVSSATSSTPADFWERFLQLAGGTTIERVSWYGLVHFSDGQQDIGCAALVGDQIGAEQTVCFRGIFSVSGGNTALSGIYFPTTE